MIEWVRLLYQSRNATVRIINCNVTKKWTDNESKNCGMLTLGVCPFVNHTKAKLEVKEKKKKKLHCFELSEHMEHNQGSFQTFFVYLIFLTQR